MDEDNDTFEDLYEHCTAQVERLTLENKLQKDQLLQLYAYYKQAKDGDADENNAPSMFDFKATAKFNKWLECKGLSEEDAQKCYILTFASLDGENEVMCVNVSFKMILI